MPYRKFSSKKVGRNLRKIRQALKMSQTEFGKMAGNYSQDTVAMWEASQVPHALVLLRIADRAKAKGANVSVDSILRREKLTVARLVIQARPARRPNQKRKDQ